MIDMEKSKLEAEAIAKLQKEQYFREVLAGELGVMIDQHFASKEPLREVLPKFVGAIKDLAVIARQIFDYIEDVSEKQKEDPEQAAEPEPEKEPTKAAEKVTNEEIMELAHQGLTAKQIADKTGMKANTVCHRIAYLNDKSKREQDIEKPAPKPRAYTRDIISDAELEEQYFKRGLTIKAIAENLGINPSSLYKRIEAMRNKRYEIAKECVSSQQ